MKRRLFKLVLAVVGILLGASIALYIIGGRTAAYRADIEIDASPAIVFDYLTEADLLLQWMDGVTKIEPLTGGGHRVEARARITIAENGSEFVLEDEVLQSVRGQLLQIRLTSPAFVGVSTYDLHSHGDSTHLSHELRADYAGVARLFAPFVAGSAQRKMASDFVRLKRIIESRAEDDNASSEPAEPDPQPDGGDSGQSSPDLE